MTPVVRLVRSTHEAFDGGGYPDGLTGEQIPLGARIIAVYDAFDAMTSDRSYRRAMPRRRGGRAAPLRALAVRSVGGGGVLRAPRRRLAR